LKELPCETFATHVLLRDIHTHTHTAGKEVVDFFAVSAEKVSPHRSVSFETISDHKTERERGRKN